VGGGYAIVSAPPSIAGWPAGERRGQWIQPTTKGLTDVPESKPASETDARGRSSLTLEKGIRILDCFDVEHSEWSLKDLCVQAGVARPAYRLVKTLIDLKYLARDPSRGTYHLGPGLMKAAYLMSSHTHLARVSHPYMEELAAETTESVVMAVWMDHEILVTDVVLTPRPFRPSIPVGTIMPGFCTAHAKLFLAFGPEQKRKWALSQPLSRRTEHTVLDPVELEEVLKQVRQEGVAFCLQEWQMGMCALAAPIFDSNGDIVAGLAIVAPNERFGPAEMRVYAAATRRTAAQISQRLGYQPASSS
jgi:DNA-binding IclR family transcriptional regulator